MKNHPDTVELLQKIDKLLTAVESLHNCLQTLEAVPNDSYDIARTQLRNAAREASHVIERHRSTQELNQKSEQNVPHSLALLASAEAAEWRANELRKMAIMPKHAKPANVPLRYAKRHRKLL